MAQDSRQEAYERLYARSYKNLEKASLRLAAAKNGYSNSTQTRTDLWELFRERFSQDPYKWQIDVTEAILLKLDSVVIAGTGAGRTMPFIMSLLLDPARKVIIMIVSPLKVLQVNQAAQFQKMNISTAAVNGDTWNAELEGGLADNVYQGILTSPEMCLQHSAFRKILMDEKFKRRNDCHY